MPLEVLRAERLLHRLLVHRLLPVLPYQEVLQYPLMLLYLLLIRFDLHQHREVLHWHL
jgi:hypothetical protein